MTPPTERLLLGPGPSPVAPRVMRAMTAPVLSHLDPEMMAILDDIRSRLTAAFQAADGSLSLAIGAGLGPLAGRIWRVGLMGSGSTRENITRLVDALKTLLAR